jgi:selenocysteine lyase/cysteine desulfurase
MDVASIKVAAIASHRFAVAHAFFNAAALGLVSHEARAAARSHRMHWHVALENARTSFGVLLRRPPEYISLFHNTTAAAQRALARVARVVGPRCAMLLTTDLEYPGIVSMIDDTWPGPVAMVELAKLALDRLPHALALTLKQAVLLTRPSVVYVSQVARSLGCLLLNEEMLGFMKEVNPRTLIVVDGAQALGNIDTSPRFYDLCDFYLASGHKWLGCIPTLGVLSSHPRWSIADPAQAYSHLQGSRSTGNIDVLRAAVAALEEFGSVSDTAAAECASRIAAHNRLLAAQFCKLLGAEALPLAPWHSCGIDDDCPLPSNGIAVAHMATRVSNTTIDTSGDVHRAAQIAAQGKVMITRLAPERWVSSSQDAPVAPRLILRRVSDTLVPQAVNFRDDALYTPLPQQAFFRFCFHHYHSSDDVRNLVARLRGGFELD